jgi:Holliday junction DNA helicase RuvB
MNDDILSSERQNEEVQFEEKLRPQSCDEFIGQTGLLDQMRVFIAAAKQRSEPLDHLLLYGPPGLGKTTLAHIVANELGSRLVTTSGPVLERKDEAASLLTDLQEGDVLFIDEVHRMNRTVEEFLYPAMEDYSIDIVIGQGPTSKTIQLDVTPFTLIGATTRAGLLSGPIRSRFGITHRLNFYTEEEMEQIIKRSARILGVEIVPESTSEIARRSRRTPRIANRLLRRVRDYAQVKGDGLISSDITEVALESLEVDGLGLDPTDRLYVNTIINNFQGGPVGVNTIAVAMGEDVGTIEDIIEPFLIQIGFLNRTPKGRVLTPAAFRHLDAPLPQNSPAAQSGLFDPMV